jgi:hypothetical protein
MERGVRALVHPVTTITLTSNSTQHIGNGRASGGATTIHWLRTGSYDFPVCAQSIMPPSEPAYRSEVLLYVNGKRHVVKSPDPTLLLADYLRDTLLLKGTKVRLDVVLWVVLHVPACSHRTSEETFHPAFSVPVLPCARRALDECLFSPHPTRALRL